MPVETQEILEKLQLDDRQSKLFALKALLCECSDQKVSSVVLLKIFDECYLHLLKCYSDRFESVREQAVETVSQFVARLPANDFHLLNIVGTLLARMGQEETVEGSEEMRFAYMTQLHMLIKRYIAVNKERSLQECYVDMVPILLKAVRDPFPNVQREACACIVSLASSAETITFQQWSEKIAVALYSMLNHKHSQVRLAAIKALASLALHINASGEALTRLFMEVSPLLMDPMPLVRRECGNFGIVMLLDLKDRYSYFERIIPFVLCCLKDDSPEVIEHIRPLWVNCGRQFYYENEAELSKQDIADLQPENYPINVQRPTIGCRGLVQRSLRLLPLITRESSDWKDNVRLHSLKLLYQFVLHAEAAMTAKFFEIYPDVARACSDSECAVANEAIKVADLMGRVFSYEAWSEHGFEGLSKNVKIGYLKCFYYMFNASIRVTYADILRVSEMLIASEFSQTLSSDFQLYVIILIEVLIEKFESYHQEKSHDNAASANDHEVLDKNLYVTTIKVMALSSKLDCGDKVLQAKSEAILDKIAQSQNITVARLHEKYFALALAYVENLDAPLDECSEPIILLNGLVRICQFRSPYMPDLQAKLTQVWQNCANNAKIKIFSSISIAMLKWNETIAMEIEQSAKILKEFTTTVVEPHLVWSAGANAEVMRVLAMATLCSLSQGAREEAQLVLPTFAQYIPTLLEDRSTTTRNYAVKCLFNFGEVDVETLKPIAYATLQRFDDPSAAIRELAALAIPKLCPKFKQAKGEEGEYEHELWEQFIARAFDMMFIHFEGPEIRVQNAIKAAIIELSSKYMELCEASYKRTVAVSYSGFNLKELQSELPFVADKQLKVAQTPPRAD